MRFLFFALILFIADQGLGAQPFRTDTLPDTVLVRTTEVPARAENPKLYTGWVYCVRIKDPEGGRYRLDCRSLEEVMHLRKQGLKVKKVRRKYRKGSAPGVSPFILDILGRSLPEIIRILATRRGSQTTVLPDPGG